MRESETVCASGCERTCTRCVKKQSDKEAAKDSNEKKRGCD